MKWQHAWKAKGRGQARSHLGLQWTWRPLERHRKMWETDYRGYTSTLILPTFFAKTRLRINGSGQPQTLSKERDLWLAMEQPAAALLSGLAFA